MFSNNSHRSQPGYKYRPPPKLDRTPQDDEVAFKKHFDQELDVYGRALASFPPMFLSSHTLPYLCRTRHHITAWNGRLLFLNGAFADFLFTSAVFELLLLE